MAHPASRSFFFLSLFFVSLFTFTACHDSQDDNATALVQVKPVPVSTQENDQHFLVSAAEFNWEEILLAKLAFRRVSSEEVRQLSQVLENTSRDNKLALGSLAVMKSISVPSEPTIAAQASYDKLNAFLVEEFDVAYCNMIIDAHKNAIAIFENAAHETLDPQIQAKAVAILPGLRANLINAVACQSHINPVSALVR